VSYGNDPAQRMDIYLPAKRNSATTKFMVLFHGGGWRDGDKSEFTIFIDSMRKRFPDWAFFNVNYRLYKDGSNVFPTQENDVRAAVEFILSKNLEYQVSKNHVLLGASAGAHLALLQAYKNSSVKPKAAISFFGPTDLGGLYQTATDPFVQLLLKALTGTTPELHSDTYQQSSPIHFVNSTSCPTLLLHGDKDALVPMSQSQLLKSKLDHEQVPNKLVIYHGLGHGWLGSPLNDSFNQVQLFLQEHVQ
jgi:acetyl esterase/lipase